VIQIQNVSKVYSLFSRPSDRLLAAVPGFASRRGTEFWALKNIRLTVESGEFLGLIGPNGSGKSTLLQIVSGILQPTHGRVLTEGRVAALLELGAGFNLEFTGRENVYLNGEIMGLSRREVDRSFPRIAAFADIGEFIDRPVKEYSSGMYVRLAFATAIHVDPEILIVDEALAVGDAIFANRCIQKLEELKRRNVTVLFVSHDLGLVKQLSDRAVLMLHGEIHAQGNPADVVNRYVGLVHRRQREDQPENAARTSAAGRTSFRHGDGASEVLRVELRNAAGEEITALESGELVRVCVTTKFHRAIDEPIVGILIRNRLGLDIYGTNTKLEGRRLGRFEAGDRLSVEFSFPCLLSGQEYTLTVATQYWDGASQDWLDDVLPFTVVSEKALAGVVDLGAEVRVHRTFGSSLANEPKP
jgi:lipopolysaccharide transport system ATP-binding protein